MMKGKLPLSFSALSVGKLAAVALCVVAVGTTVATWQGGALFGADFSWTNSSYAIQQAYDSTAFQVEEDAESDNQVSQDDPAEEKAADPGLSASNASGGNAPLSGTVVPSEEEVVIGSGGTASGGNPSQGEGPPGGGTEPGPGPGPGPDPEGPTKPDPEVPEEIPEIIDPGNRFEEMTDPSLGYESTQPTYTLVGYTLTGRGKTTVYDSGLSAEENLIQPSDVAKHVSGYMVVKKVDTGETKQVTFEESKFAFGEGEKRQRPASKGQVQITISYADRGLGVQTPPMDVVCDVYEHRADFIVVNANGSESTSSAYFNGERLVVPSEAWQLALEPLKTPDGSLSALFPGWSYGSQMVTDSLTVKQGDIAFDVRARVSVPLPEGMRVEPREAAQVLTRVDPSSPSIAGGRLDIPEGVNGLSFANGEPNASVTTIHLASTVFDVDIPSVLQAFPNLTTWEVEGDNQRYATTGDGILVSRTQDGSFRIASVPPCSSAATSATVVVDEGVIGFEEHAFEGISWPSGGPLLVFGVDEVEIQEWDTLPANAQIAAPPSPYDLVYCRYLAAFSQHRPDLILADQKPFQRQGGFYAAGEQGDEAIYFYGDHSTALAYLPDISTSSYRMNETVSKVLTTAFMDCSSLSNVIIPGTVTAIEAGALTAPDLHSIILEDPDSVQIEPGQKLFAPAAAYPSDFTLYLACDKGDSAYQKWLDQLALSWGSSSEAAAHILCTGSDGSVLETDGETGAVYQRDGRGLTLLSVPQKTATLTVKEGTIAIGADALRGAPALRALILPESLEVIPSKALSGCGKLEAVIFPDALAEGVGVARWAADVGLTAGSGCTALKLLGASSDHQWDGTGVFYRKMASGLEAIYGLDAAGELYPEGIIKLLPNTTTIGEEAFAGDATVCGIAGDRSVTTVGPRAFQGCTALAHIDVLASLKTVGASAFAGAGLEGTLSLQGDGLTIAPSAFEGCSRLGDVEFSGTINNLGSQAFKGCTSMTRVVFGDDLAGLQAMGSSLFEGSEQLSEVTFSVGVRTIGEAAFKDCTNLRSVLFPESGAQMTSIGDRAFMGCVKLETLNLHRLAQLQTIGADAFSCREAGARVAAASSRGGALKGSIYFPGSLISIGDRAFANQQSLEKLYLHGDVSRLRTVGVEAFGGCQNLYAVDLHEASSGLDIGSRAFEGNGKLSSVTLPKSLQSVGARAFAQCIRLMNLTIKGPAADPCQWSVLGEEAFMGCAALQSLELSSTRIQKISRGAFAQCTSLAMIVLPSTLTSIESGAFQDCKALTLVNVLAEVPPQLSSDAFAGCTLDQLSVQVARSNGDIVLGRYQDDQQWLDLVGGDAESITSPGVDDVIQMGAGEYKRSGSGYALVRVDPSKAAMGFQLAPGTVRIEAGAFQGCQRILSVLIPSSVTSVATGAFAGCSGLENLIFQGDRPPAFEGDPFAGQAVLDGFRIYVVNVDHAPNYFGSLASLVRFKLAAGGNVFAIDLETGALYTTYDAGIPSAFDVLLRVPRAMTGSLTVASDTRFIANKAAAGCIGLTQFTVGNECMSIGDEAFKGCTGLSSAKLGKDLGSAALTQIGQSAFEGCTSLATIHPSSTVKVIMPYKLEKIGSFAFKDCISIASFQVNGKVEEVPEGMLAGCTSLDRLTAGNSYIGNIKRFGKDLFRGCTAMTATGASLAAFSNLEEIGEGAYAGCSNLSLAVFPASLRSIGPGAFSGCGSIEFAAFNGATPVPVAGSGLPEVWRSGTVPVFVPQDAAGGMIIAQAYEASWQGDAPLQGVDAVAPSYRTVAGNLYAEITYTSIYEMELALLSTSLQGCVDGRVAVYKPTATYQWKTIYVNEYALKGKTYVHEFWPGANCVGTKNKPGIGDGAFDGTGGSQGLRLDLSAMSAVPYIGNKIFGQSVPEGTRILVKDEAMAELMAAIDQPGQLGAQLLEDYGKRLVRDESITDAVALMLVDAATVATDDAESQEAADAVLDADAVTGEGTSEPGSADEPDNAGGDLPDAAEPAEPGSASGALGDNEDQVTAPPEAVAAEAYPELTEEGRP